MSDETAKWRSPTGHSISSHETDRLPMVESVSDAQRALDALELARGAINTSKRYLLKTRESYMSVGFECKNINKELEEVNEALTAIDAALKGE